MKYLLTIILFMSVNVFADFNITTLDCELGLHDPNGKFGETLSVRLDEKNMEMRVNLFPISPISAKSSSTDALYEIEFVFLDTTYLFRLGAIDLKLSSYKKLKNKWGIDEEFSGFYSCKII